MNMRIVHVEDFFHPDAGYQVNILAKYQVTFGHEVIVITSEMEKIPQDLTAFFGRDHIEEHDKAYEQAYDTAFTDDASVVLKYGKNLSYLLGERFNIKLTTQDDLILAKAILSLSDSSSR